MFLTENNTIILSSEDSMKFNDMQYVRLDECSISSNNGEYLISRIFDAYKLKDCRNISASDDCTETYTTNCNPSIGICAASNGNIGKGDTHNGNATACVAARDCGVLNNTRCVWTPICFVGYAKIGLLDVQTEKMLP